MEIFMLVIKMLFFDGSMEPLFGFFNLWELNQEEDGIGSWGNLKTNKLAKKNHMRVSTRFAIFGFIGIGMQIGYFI